MRRTKNPKWNRLLLAVAALLLVVQLVGVSLAAYTSQGFLRGVARNRDNDNIRFSSNYMSAISTSDTNYIRRVLTYDQSGSDDIDIEIFVYNYAQGNKTLVNENDITYDMTITLSGGTQTEYTVKYGDQQMTGDSSQAGLAYTQKSTMTGRTPQQDKYTVTIPRKDLDKVKITAVARPQNAVVTGNRSLACVLLPYSLSSLQSFSCTGSYADAASGHSPSEYAALNYEVVVSSGRAQVTLHWEPDQVELDPYFLEKLKQRKTGGTQTTSDTQYTYDKDQGTLKFVMDQPAGEGDYVIPFYFVKSVTLPDTWDALTTQKLIWVEGKQIQDTASDSASAGQ